MSLARKLFVNWVTKKRQRSDKSGSPDVIDRLSFYKYSKVPFEVVIVEPKDSGTPNDFNRVSVTDLSLRMGIGDTKDDSSPLAEFTAWTKNTANNTFTGILDCNTGAMSSYIGSADKIGYFEIQVTDSAGALEKIVSEECDLRVGVLTTTTSSPDPNKIFLELDTAKGLFVTREMGDGESITFKNGIYRRVIGLNPDGSGQDDYYSI